MSTYSPLPVEFFADFLVNKIKNLRLTKVNLYKINNYKLQYYKFYYKLF